MAHLIDILESFNRKERYFLLTRTLDMHAEGNTGEFQLNEKFRKELLEEIGQEQLDIRKSYVAMDYHLDWIHGSLTLAYPDRVKSKLGKRSEVFSYECNEITGTQEDIDLLVAFEVENKYHLVFIEAKGYSSWDTEQLYRKVKRLGKIFGENRERYCDDVKPYFVLMSEKPPNTENWSSDRQPAYWPKWMRCGENKIRYHLPMCLPDRRNRRRVERCNEEGIPSSTNKYFHCPQP